MERADKTLLEVEEAGFEYSAFRISENDEAVYTVSYGLYQYDLLLDVTYAEYMEHDDSSFIGDLTIRNASFSGVSRNAAELRFHADGTYDEESDAWAEYNEMMAMISNALSGDNPEEAIQAIIDTMPEHAEEIQALVEIFSAMNGQADE